MPRGKKTCPQCNAEHGPRTHKCGCGHEFFKSAVPASTEPMVVDHKQIISDLKQSVSKIESRNSQSVVADTRQNVVQTVRQNVQSPPISHRAADQRISIPAGLCSIRPKGFKNDKWEEPWTEEVVKEWAEEVYNSGLPYLPEAVVYFARYFWDINGSDFKKIRSFILEALIPKKSCEFEEELPEELPEEELVTS